MLIGASPPCRAEARTIAIVAVRLCAIKKASSELPEEGAFAALSFPRRCGGRHWHRVRLCGTGCRASQGRRPPPLWIRIRIQLKRMLSDRGKRVKVKTA